MNTFKLKSINKNIIFICVLVVAIIILGGISYAYFISSVSGNDTAKSTQVQAGTISLVLDGTKITGISNALPGHSKTINFSVTNTGTLTATYALTIEKVLNNFADPTELVYSITSTNGGGMKNQTMAPLKNSTLINNIQIAAGVTQNYKLTLHFLETGNDQNNNQNKTFNGQIQIVDSANVIDNIPDEYTQLTYLTRKSGDAYIDTGYMPSHKTKTHVGFSPMNSGFIYGSRTSGTINTHAIYVDPYQVYNQVGTNSSAVKASVSYNQYHIFTNSLEGGYFDGVKIKDFSDMEFNSNLSMYLFGLNQAGTLESRQAGGKMYYFEIYEYNELKYNFIPAMRNSDNVYGMFETINQTFYTNVGSGNFIGE